MPARSLPSTHPLVLLAASGLGVLAGAFLPPLHQALALAAGLAVNLLQMSALPLLGVATAFGVRQLLAWPHPGRRAGMVLVVAALLLACGGLTGALLGHLLQPGQGLGASDLLQLGRAAQQPLPALADSASQAIHLYRPEADLPPTPPRTGWPDNPFAALAQGAWPAVLGCALVFGLALAHQPRERQAALSAHLEAVYRVFERMIRHVNLALPLMVAGLASELVTHTEGPTLDALAGVLGALLLGTVLLAALAVAALCRQARCGPARVVAALRGPLLVGACAPHATAAIPPAIDALSERLGFSRGTADLLVPLGALLLRVGHALQAALVACFVAQLYGEPAGLGASLLLGVAAAVAALLTPTPGPWAGLGATVLLLQWWQLPPEGVLPALLVVDRLADVPRNLLTVLALAVLVGALSRGLPSERQAEALATPAAPAVQLELAPTALATVVVATVLAGLLSLALGVGLGWRRALRAPAGPPPLAASSAAAPTDAPPAGGSPRSGPLPPVTGARP